MSDQGGNNVLAFCDLNFDNVASTSEAIQQTHYYPFGMQMYGLGTTQTGPENKYKMAGKELQDEFNLQQYDFGARYYDPAIARWNSPDPLADVVSDWTPFRYGFNNPMTYSDPSGMMETTWDGQEDMSSSATKTVTPRGPGRVKGNYSPYRGRGQNGSAGDGSPQGSVHVTTSENGYIDAPSVRREYGGNDALTIRGPVNYSTGTGGYKVSVHPGAGFLTNDDGSVNGFIDPSNNGIYDWNPAYNAFYDRISNEIYGGSGVNIINAYMHTTTGGAFGQSDHPYSSIGNGIGKTQNIINTIAAAGNLANLGMYGIKYGASKFAQSLFLSEKFGITSVNFGSSLAKAQGSLNRPGGLFKMGWSSVSANGGGMKMRIGIGYKSANPNQAFFHIYLPGTFVPNSYANPSIQVKLSIFKLGL